MPDSDFKILVVEDDKEFREVLVDICSLCGCEADYAASGTDALALMSENSEYGLIIIDYLMPEMHGVELTHRVRKKWPILPVIAMSAWDDVKSLFIEAGAYLFLKKPFDLHLLAKEIASISGSTAEEIRIKKE